MRRLKILGIICCVLLVGCSIEIDITAIEKSMLFCQDKGGVKIINNSMFIGEYCKCNNGTFTWLENIELVYCMDTNTYTYKKGE